MLRLKEIYSNNNRYWYYTIGNLGHCDRWLPRRGSNHHHSKLLFFEETFFFHLCKTNNYHSVQPVYPKIMQTQICIPYFREACHTNGYCLRSAIRKKYSIVPLLLHLFTMSYVFEVFISFISNILSVFLKIWTTD